MVDLIDRVRSFFASWPLSLPGWAESLPAFPSPGERLLSGVWLCHFDLFIRTLRSLQLSHHS
jgi:hypothetical protein